MRKLIKSLHKKFFSGPAQSGKQAGAKPAMTVERATAITIKKYGDALRTLADR